MKEIKLALGFVLVGVLFAVEPAGAAPTGASGESQRRLPE